MDKRVHLKERFDFVRTEILFDDFRERVGKRKRGERIGAFGNKADAAHIVGTKIDRGFTDRISARKVIVERGFVYTEERCDVGEGDGARAFFKRTREKGLQYFIAVDPFFCHAVIISKSAVLVSTMTTSELKYFFYAEAPAAVRFLL